MKRIKPVPNNNGSPRATLVEDMLDARRALLDAVTAMTAAAPHGRDYQHGGDYPGDWAEARMRIAQAQELADAYYQDAIELQGE
ncbi:MAG: hypothetical protein DRQ48_00245 [Gammaproteobacteria bacterium]|nr:MAG: hypothetical protein DRQ48_00245 [Gammaproteobacteria bacterium]